MIHTFNLDGVIQ